jgi:ORF6N domain
MRILRISTALKPAALTRAVRRNKDRFPDDFMFQLTNEEWSSLRSQTGISNEGRGGRRYATYVFTEQGVAMLSSVLRSKRAIAVNIAIMRAFVERFDALRRPTPRSRSGSKISNETQSEAWAARSEARRDLQGAAAADLSASAA